MDISACMTHIFSLSHTPLGLDEFCLPLRGFFPQYADLANDCFLECLIALGAPIRREGTCVFSTLSDLPLDKCRLCFVDVESTSGDKKGQVIEVGALKLEGGQITEVFESLVYAPHVPGEIRKLTGIDAYMLKGAPSLYEVLSDFREFIRGCIFVAHNVSFDFESIFLGLVDCGLPPILNPFLCTLGLSRKTLMSSRHALPYLDIALGINTGIKHRALPDAFTSLRLYEICRLGFPLAVNSFQDLFDFSTGKLAY